MEWNSITNLGGTWTQQIQNLEAKQIVGKRLAERLQPGDIVGVGSGSTAFIAIQALAARSKQENIPFTAIPTSHEVGLTCASFGIATTSLMHKRPDWSFDGCDEVDGDHNMIKGRGGAMFREKLLMSVCPEVYILVDHSKLVEKLGQNFPIPVEVVPDSVPNIVELIQKEFKATKVVVRPAQGKDGPVITESGNIILDADFDNISPSLEKELKGIVGVVESGLFCGYKFELITG
jgi:ribose 5-phosphate isomerase A